MIFAKRQRTWRHCNNGSADRRMARPLASTWIYPERAAGRTNASNANTWQAYSRCRLAEAMKSPCSPIVFDEAAWNELEANRLGRTVIITDREDWPVERIVGALREQSHVESAFRQLKDPQWASAVPLRHYTDPLLRVHAFVSVLALMLSKLVVRRLKRGGITITVSEAMRQLSDLRLAEVSFSAEAPPALKATARERCVPPRPSADQAKMVRVLGIGDALRLGPTYRPQSETENAHKIAMTPALARRAPLGLARARLPVARARCCLPLPPRKERGACCTGTLLLALATQKGAGASCTGTLLLALATQKGAGACCTGTLLLALATQKGAGASCTGTLLLALATQKGQDGAVRYWSKNGLLPGLLADAVDVVAEAVVNVVLAESVEFSVSGSSLGALRCARPANSDGAISSASSSAQRTKFRWRRTWS